MRGAIQELARELAPACSEGHKVGVLVDRGAGQLERYIAAVLAFFMQEQGANACAGTTPVVPAELPERLTLGVLTVVEPRDIEIAVLLKLFGEEPAYRLQASAYRLGQGERLASVEREAGLGPELSFLLRNETRQLAAADRQWFALFARVFTPCRMPQNNPADRLAVAEGTYLFEQGMWSEALARLRKVSGDEPDLCLVRTAMALREIGETDEALRRVEEALKLRPDSGPLYALKAWLLLRRDAPEDALIFLEQARLSDLPHEGHYWLARHLIALEKGESDTAEQAVLKAVELLPGEPFPRIAAAQFYWRQARLQEAVRLYRAALDAGASGADVWIGFGMALDATGRSEQALDALRRAFELEPGNVNVARHLSSVLKAAARYDEALSVLKRASEVRADRMDLLAAYADYAAELWRTQQAQDAYAQMIERQPDSAEGKVGQARMLIRRRRYAEAQELLEQVLAARPDCQPARLALASILAKRGQGDEAVEMLQEAARDPATEVAARLALARLHSRHGEHEEAVHQAQIAVAARPDAETYAALARAFAAAKQWEKARMAVAKALQSGPRAAVAHLAAAELAAASQEHERALAAAEQAVTLNPNSPQGLELAGKLCLRLGQPQRAVEQWLRAVELNPWDPELRWELAEALRNELDRPGQALEHYRWHVELGGQHSEEAKRLIEQLEPIPAEAEPQGRHDPPGDRFPHRGRWRAAAQEPIMEIGGGTCHTLWSN